MAKQSSSASASSPVQEELPYRIDLWRADRTDDVELLLARAITLQLARAIFKAAAQEHPTRRVTLRSGERFIADSTTVTGQR